MGKGKKSIRTILNKSSLGNPMLQSRMNEIPMPQELMEHIFDSSTRIGYETEEEAEYRLRKEEYNRSIMKKIRKLDFTDRQREIFDLMYRQGLSMTETARLLGVIPTTIQEIKEAIFRKIKKGIEYDFSETEETL